MITDHKISVRGGKGNVMGDTILGIPEVEVPWLSLCYHVEVRNSTEAAQPVSAPWGTAPGHLDTIEDVEDQ